jgi:hypothetical protein
VHHQLQTLAVELFGSYAPSIELTFEIGVAAVCFPEVYLGAYKINHFAPSLFFGKYPRQSVGKCGSGKPRSNQPRGCFFYQPLG